MTAVKLRPAPLATAGASAGATGGATATTGGPVPRPAPRPRRRHNVGALAVGRRPAAPQGNIDNLELVFFNNEASAVASFQAGNLDAVGDLTPESMEAAATRAGASLTRYPLTSLYSVVLNQRAAHPEFGKLSVRQGLLAAIDRSTILQTALLGLGTVADGPLPSWSPAYDPTAVTATAYSTSDAQADLTSSGWVHGQSGWTLPNAKSQYTIQLLTPGPVDEPRHVPDRRRCGSGVAQPRARCQLATARCRRLHAKSVDR